MNVMSFSGILLFLATDPSFAQGEQPNGGVSNGQQQRKLPKQQVDGMQQAPARRRAAELRKNHSASETHQASVQRGQPQRQRTASHAFHQGHAPPQTISHQAISSRQLARVWAQSPAERSLLGTGE